MCLLSFGNKKKSHGPDLGNIVAAALLVWCFWPKIRCCFWSKLSNFGANLAVTRIMPKSFKIEWHEPIDMFRSSASSLSVIRRLTNTIFFTSSMFSSVVDVVGRPTCSSSFTPSRPPENILYNWYTLLRCKVASPYVTVNIRNASPNLILFSKQNFIQILWCNFWNM